MLTDTEWDRLLNPAKTAPHIQFYANQVYNRSNPEAHTLHMLKCLSKLPKREHTDWYIVEDVLYHLPTYDKTFHKYQPGDNPILNNDSMRSLSKTGVKMPRLKNAHSSE